MKRVKGSSKYWYKKEALGHSIYIFEGTFRLIAQVKGFAKVHEFVKAQGAL